MRRLVLSFPVALLLTSTASAQTEPPAGVRATAMGGAFVAVADDASAVFWNPAGLASGSYFSLAVDDNRLQTPDDTAFPHRRSAFMVAVAAPALGFSYFSTTVTRVVAAVATAEPVTSAQPSASQNAQAVVRVERLSARHIGATLVQSIAGNVAVGATVKLVRGTASAGLINLRDTGSFDAAEDLFPKAGTTSFDTDLGLMVAGRFAKAGVAVRNLFEPKFETPGGAPIALERRVRGGVSLLLRTVTLAADADFTKASTSLGTWRDAAIGAEAHPVRRAWVRGGFHWNTAAEDSGPGAAPIASVGGSYAVYGSVLADGQVSFGSEHGDQGWGVGLRFVF